MTTPSPRALAVVGLFPTAIAELDRGLTGELEAILGGVPVEQRALLHLREKGLDPAVLDPPAATELLALTTFKLEHEFAVAQHNLEDYEEGGAGRRPNSFAHNLLIVAALEEKGSPALAARWLGPPITEAQIRKAAPKAAKVARVFLGLIHDDRDAEAFLRSKIAGARRCLIETDDLLRRANSDRANAGAHPAARKYYHDVHDQTLEPTLHSITAAVRDQSSALAFSNAAVRFRSKQ